MTTLRRFRCDDLFNFNAVNLDYFTETVRAWPPSRHVACFRGSAWLVISALARYFSTCSMRWRHSQTVQSSGSGHGRRYDADHHHCIQLLRACLADQPSVPLLASGRLNHQFVVLAVMTDSLFLKHHTQLGHKLRQRRCCYTKR